MKKTLFLALLLLTTILIISCGTAPQPHVTPTRTATQTATRTPELTPTISPTSSPTFTSTPPSIQARYEFPYWVGDFKYSVFSIITDVSANSNELTLINADTHEKFSIRLPSNDVTHYFWTPDGKSFGLVSADFLTVFMINLKSGEVTEYDIPESYSQCLSEYDKQKQPIMRRLNVYHSLPLDASSFCIDPKFEFSHYFFLYGEEKQGKHIITMEDSITGQTIEFPDPHQDLANIEFQISASENRFAVLQGPVSPNRDDPWFPIPAGTFISVYDVPTRKLIASFEGLFCSLIWSPDGEKLLTNIAEMTDCYPGAWVPLILYPDISQSHPVTPIDDAKNSGNSFHTSLYSWSPDSNFLYYEFSALNRGDLYRYDVKNDNSIALTSGLRELDKLNVEGYSFSPNRDFVTFSYGYSCSGCDYWGEPSSVLMRIDGSDLLKLGKEIQEIPGMRIDITYPYGTLSWRPMLVP